MGEPEATKRDRARIADERDRRADARDRRADERERVADDRERTADRRETSANDREERIKYYEARFETALGTPPDFDANLADLEKQSLERASAEVARAKDRLTATSDRTRREQAEIDREVARSVRDNQADG
ncbi:hypothetical protein [Amycolatopsis sp. MEPSY49]|uniref:hypothetical protein n=1 Tax=Amycolatopsis sp. MEPSY49 TaxID=3151600 RepID=UPI003EF750EC